MRRCYNDSLIVIRFDGDLEPKQELELLRHDSLVQILEEPELFPIDHGGMLCQRMLDLMLQSGAEIMIKIDPDTAVQAPFKWLPDAGECAIYGSVQKSHGVESIQGGCIIFTRASAEKLYHSRLLESDRLKPPELAWMQNLIHRGYIEGLSSIDWCLGWAGKQLAIPMRNHPEVLSVWRYHQLKVGLHLWRAAVVHPNVGWLGAFSPVNVGRKIKTRIKYQNWIHRPRSEHCLHMDDFDDWNLPKGAVAWIVAHCKQGSKILEFGSGRSTRELRRLYDVTAVEENDSVERYEGVSYAVAPIKDEWYDPTCIEPILSQRYEAVIIDGPFAGERSVCRRRLGFLKYHHLLPGSPHIIVDDIHRPYDFLNLVLLWIKVRRNVFFIFSGSKACAVLHGNEPFTVTSLIRNIPASVQLLKLLYWHIRRSWYQRFRSPT